MNPEQRKADLLEQLQAKDAELAQLKLHANALAEALEAESHVCFETSKDRILSALAAWKEFMGRKS